MEVKILYNLPNILRIELLIGDEFGNPLENMLIDIGLFNPTSEAGKDIYIIYSNQDVRLLFSSDINEVLIYVEECIAINMPETDRAVTIISDRYTRILGARDSTLEQDVVFEATAYSGSPHEIIEWVNSITTNGKTIKFSKEENYYA